MHWRERHLSVRSSLPSNCVSLSSLIRLPSFRLQMLALPVSTEVPCP